MKTWLRLSSLLAAFSTLALVAQTARADLVYDNTTNFLTTFNPGTFEVGDEIILAQGARIVTNFTFEYWGLNFSGNEKAEVRFYANDGTNSLSGPNVPGTLLFDSGLFSLPVAPTGANLIFNADAFITDVVFPLTGPVPTDFTWSVQFSGLGPLASAGVVLGGTTTNTFGAGWSYPDYWYNSGSGWWEMRTNISYPVNFEAQIYAIPEPTVMVFGLLGGLSLLALKFRNNRR